MRGFVDIHSHWLPGVDDGATTAKQGLNMLAGLKAIGFDTVCATPHMRTALFDNRREELELVFERMSPRVDAAEGMPRIALGCEHHLDDLVFERLLDGAGLPYPTGRTALIELPYDHFPVRLSERLFQLRQKRIRSVLAHPERYRPVWKDIEALDPLLDGGTVLALDVGALAGQFGRGARRAAEELTEAGYYYAAVSDAHREADLKHVAQGIDRLFDILGKEEAEFMLIDGPQSVLDGQIVD